MNRYEIRARIDEDEAAAKAVDQEPQRPVIGDTDPRPVRWYSKREYFAPEDGYPAPYVDEKRTALADRFGPDRVCRQSAALRKLLDAINTADAAAGGIQIGHGVAEELRTILGEIWEN